MQMSKKNTPLKIVKILIFEDYVNSKGNYEETDADNEQHNFGNKEYAKEEDNYEKNEYEEYSRTTLPCREWDTYEEDEHGNNDHQNEQKENATSKDDDYEERICEKYDPGCKDEHGCENCEHENSHEKYKK